MSDLSDTKDIMMMAGIGVAVYLLWKPVGDTKKAIGDVISNVSNYASYISKGGALKEEADRVAEEQRKVRSDITTQPDYHGLPNPFAYLVTHPYERQAQSLNNTYPSLSTSSPQLPYIAPVFTNEIGRMINSPAPNRPDIDIFSMNQPKLTWSPSNPFLKQSFL